MNWGTKIIIGLSAFMLFITTLGVLMFRSSKTDSLIEDNYYEKGQAFNQDYDAKQKALDEKLLPAFDTENGLLISFPVSVNYKLSLKRLSDQLMDKDYTGITDSDHQIKIPKEELQTGPWLIRIEYSVNGKNYLYEDKILLK
ncbi:FixH family protein [Daejeonella oryzae]|uniref:FixH family protein n=1 Tax=Daejeonella oryzae TaxID=1122943 RepID=UPI00041AB404|nr:FixH family protein [Daejeonella oryzae]